MAEKTATKKRVVQKSAKTGTFSHKAARAAARKAAAKRTSSAAKGR